MSFHRVASIADVPDPGRTLVEVEDRLVVLFHVGGKFYAIDDVCTHDDGPLSEGQLSGFEIACPRHGAKFDIRTGAALTMPATKPTAAHDVKIEGNEVFVQLRTSGNVEPMHGEPMQGRTAANSPPPTPAPAAVPNPLPVNAPPAAASDSPSGPLNEDVCREALKQVVDPELFVNIVDLGLVYVVQVTDKDEGKHDVLVEMTMTSPACPAGPQLLHNSKEVLKRLPGVDEVEVKLVMTPPWTPDRMTDDARDQLGIF